MALTNSEIKLIRSLQQKKNRVETGLFIVEGVKLIEELIRAKSFEIKAIYSTQKIESVETIIITQKELERISNLKSANTCLALVKIPLVKLNYYEDDFVLIVDGVNDPGNLGTIIRTADWFGIRNIILSTNSVELFNPKVVQSTMGAIFRVQVHYADLENSIPELKKEGFAILGACMEGNSYLKQKLNSKTALVMGSESHGISGEILTLLDTAITIPRKGESESLNLGVATGILLSHFCA